MPCLGLARRCLESLEFFGLDFWLLSSLIPHPLFAPSRTSNSPLQFIRSSGTSWDAELAFELCVFLRDNPFTDLLEYGSFDTTSPSIFPPPKQFQKNPI